MNQHRNASCPDTCCTDGPCDLLQMHSISCDELFFNALEGQRVRPDALMLTALAVSRAAPSPQVPGSSAADRRLPSVPTPDSSEPWWLLPGRSDVLSAEALGGGAALARPTCHKKTYLSWAHDFTEGHFWRHACIHLQ